MPSCIVRLGPNTQCHHAVPSPLTAAYPVGHSLYESALDDRRRGEQHRQKESGTIEITFLGGGHEIGASSALVEIGAHRILVDCGVRMSGNNVLPDFGLLAARGLPAVDAVVQTHAHFDHSGALPVFHQ